jgi:hypothetical protein
MRAATIDIQVLLVCSISSRSGDEFLCNCLTKCNPSHIVHLVVDTRPDAGITGFFTYLADEVSTIGEQVRKDFAPSSRECRVV